MGIFSWIIVGGLAGWIAGKIMDVSERGLVKNILTGIVGAFLGGLLFSLIGGTGVTGFNLWSIFVAVIGAIIFIWLVRKISR